MIAKLHLLLNDIVSSGGHICLSSPAVRVETPFRAVVRRISLDCVVMCCSVHIAGKASDASDVRAEHETPWHPRMHGTMSHSQRSPQPTLDCTFAIEVWAKSVASDPFRACVGNAFAMPHWA